MSSWYQEKMRFPKGRRWDTRAVKLMDRTAGRAEKLGEGAVMVALL